VTSLQIRDVYHEFSTIPGVKEDVTQIVLNVKKLRIKSYAPHPVQVRLLKSGAGVVTANDIEPNADIEIVNPDQVLMTLDSDDMPVEIDMTIERGVGYLAAERSDQLPIGVIPVDAIFSPVRRVSFSVEPARVEQATNFDMLSIEIETDGSITPRDALASAAETLRNLLGIVADLSMAPQGLELGEVAAPASTSPDLDLAIEELDLSERPRNCLKRARVDTIGQLVQKTEDDLLAITNFGSKSLEEVLQKLDERGLALRVKE
jgi:DNA-directed RNA polymerase subunit alpha